MFQVYILYSKTTQRFYIGSTGNITDRIHRHNNGQSKSTKTGTPWIIVYTETFVTRSEAMIREMELKSWKSHQRIAQLVNCKL